MICPRVLLFYMCVNFNISPTYEDSETMKLYLQPNELLPLLMDTPVLDP